MEKEGVFHREGKEKIGNYNLMYHKYLQLKVKLVVCNQEPVSTFFIF